MVIVDDNYKFRSMLKLLISEIGNIELLAEYSSGTQFLQENRETDADIVLMDIKMPGLSGIETTRIATGNCPLLKIIGISIYEEHDYMDQMQEAGAKGFVNKLHLETDLELAIDKVLAGELFFYARN